MLPRLGRRRQTPKQDGTKLQEAQRREQLAVIRSGQSSRKGREVNGTGFYAGGRWQGRAALQRQRQARAAPAVCPRAVVRFSGSSGSSSGSSGASSGGNRQGRLVLYRLGQGQDFRNLAAAGSIKTAVIPDVKKNSDGTTNISKWRQTFTYGGAPTPRLGREQLGRRLVLRWGVYAARLA